MIFIQGPNPAITGMI